MRKTYVQDPETGKFVEKQQFLREHHAVHTFKPFTSPVDGTRIRDAAQLRAHNQKHGVTDRRDYGPEWFDRKRNELEAERQGLTRKAKNERIQTIIHAVDQHRS